MAKEWLKKIVITREKKEHYKALMAARDVYCYLAVRVLRYSGTDVGKILNIHRSTVSHAVQRGEKIVGSSNNMIDKILKACSTIKQRFPASSRLCQSFQSYA